MIGTIRQFLSRRRQAYSRKFAPDDADAQVILEDLFKFCRFGQTPFDPNQRKTDVVIGRQEVLYRLLDHARLDLDTLFEKYNIRANRPANTGDNE